MDDRGTYGYSTRGQHLGAHGVDPSWNYHQRPGYFYYDARQTSYSVRRHHAVSDRRDAGGTTRRVPQPVGDERRHSEASPGSGAVHRSRNHHAGHSRQPQQSDRRRDRPDEYYGACLLYTSRCV